MTRYEEEQIVAGIEQAARTGVSPQRSTRPCTCAVCENEIAIGTAVVELPVTPSKLFTVCADCFKLFAICPSPRPME